jgi:hypothetical protein
VVFSGVVHFKTSMVVCSRSLSGSALLSRSMRSLVGGDVIELTLCIIWWSYVLVLVWYSLVVKHLSLGLVNMCAWLVLLSEALVVFLYYNVPLRLFGFLGLLRNKCLVCLNFF